MNLRTGHIELFVRDPLVSREFYESVLGGKVVAAQNETFVWLDFGGVEILLRPGNGSEKAAVYQEASCGLVLYTDDLEEARRELVCRGLVFRGTDGSDECLTFTDPDGNWFQLVDPGDH